MCYGNSQNINITSKLSVLKRVVQEQNIHIKTLKCDLSCQIAFSAHNNWNTTEASRHHVRLIPTLPRGGVHLFTVRDNGYPLTRFALVTTQ